jgi:hypothetical protein
VQAEAECGDGPTLTSCTLASAIAATSLTRRFSMCEQSLPTACASPSTRETVERKASRAEG